MKYDRQKEIKQLIFQKKSISNSELCQIFQASIETIRRDLNALESEGVIRRVYGGAVLNDASENENRIEMRENRASQNLEVKKRLACAMAEYIPNGTVIAMDSGTTELELAKVLAKKENLVCITNDIRVAEVVSAGVSNQVVLIGGVLNRNDLMTTGYFSMDFFNNISHIDIAILSADGFSSEVGIMDHNIEMKMMKEAYVSRASKIYSMLDSSKFRIKAPYRVCDLRKIDLVITDTKAPVDELEKIRKKGPQVIVV